MVSAVRISGVNLPIEKKLYVSLSYLFGIGFVVAKQICKAVDIDCERRTKDLSEEELDKIRSYIDKNFSVEGDLRGQISHHLQLKISIGSYMVSRHRLRLPVRGQRTKTNAKTRKGRSAPIANKKVVAK